MAGLVPAIRLQLFVQTVGTHPAMTILPSSANQPVQFAEEVTCLD